MELIKKNPYRIAGILSNATERELQKQKTKIKAYSKVGKAIKSDYDFSVLANIERTETSIEQAFSKVEQNQDKVNYALFWFLNASPFDDTAFEYLKNGDEDKAVEIWQKVTLHKEVNSKNFSAFNNLGTYQLLSPDKEDIKQGIEAKIKLIESEYFKDFVHAVADKTFTIDQHKQLKTLIDELLAQFKKLYSYSSAETIALFSNCNGSTQKYLSQKFTEEPIHKIESLVEKTKKKRAENEGNAYNLGLQLYTNCKKDLSILQSLLGENDLKYKMVADGLAKELMQCGIDYFNKWKDTEDPSDEGIKLLKYAQAIATSKQIKDKINKNLANIEDWAETAPIQEDLAFITYKLEAFQSLNDTTDNAKSLVIACKGRLQNIRNVLGARDDFYLKISSAVVNNALGMLIDVLNEAQQGIQYNQSKLLQLPGIVSNAVSVMSVIGSLEMNRQTRQRYQDNNATIRSINIQLNAVRSQRSSSGGSDDGCYIATMAYGDYEHPQVMELRKFRDEVLSKNRLGRRFIQFYYKYSPGWVNMLKNKPKINQIIRKGLDKFINTITK